MAKNPMENFEIPAEMRNVAEQSVVQARQAFDGFMTAAQRAYTKLDEQTSAAQAGARDVTHKVMEFAERNVANTFDFAQRLVRAKDVQEMMRLQAEFVRQQMDTLGQQAKELTPSGFSSAAGGTDRQGG